MSRSEVERFARDLKSDAGLHAAIDKAGRLDRAVAVATQHGYGVTVEELRTEVLARAKAAGRELSAAELDAVSGSGCSCIIRGCTAPSPLSKLK